MGRCVRVRGDEPLTSLITVRPSLITKSNAVSLPSCASMIGTRGPSPPNSRGGGWSWAAVVRRSAQCSRYSEYLRSDGPSQEGRR